MTKYVVDYEVRDMTSDQRYPGQQDVATDQVLANDPDGRAAAGMLLARQLVVPHGHYAVVTGIRPAP